MGKFIDLTGQQFGRLTVLSRAKKPAGSKSTSAFWLCKCKCGTEKIISGNVLKQGKAKSCGCLNKEKRDTTSMLGKRFGKLLVLERADTPQTVNSPDAYWLCKCDCGKILPIMGKSLRNGKTKSCGCIKRDKTVLPMLNKTFGLLTVLEDSGHNSADGHIILKCQCECGNITYVQSNNLLSNSTISCGCINSIGEKQIEDLLKENNINYKKQITFKELTGLNGGLLRFDFGIYDDNNNLQYLIEFQGEQHYDYTHSYFDNLKEHDILKEEYCKEHNIKLLKIPYWKRNKLNINDLIINGEEE